MAKGATQLWGFELVTVSATAERLLVAAKSSDSFTADSYQASTTSVLPGGIRTKEFHVDPLPHFPSSTSHQLQAKRFSVWASNGKCIKWAIMHLLFSISHQCGLLYRAV